jgi:hypothetical protein
VVSSATPGETALRKVTREGMHVIPSLLLTLAYPRTPTERETEIWILDFWDVGKREGGEGTVPCGRKEGREGGKRTGDQSVRVACLSIA